MLSSAIALPLAAHTKGSAEHLSSRYIHVDTEEVVETMLKEGFYVAAAHGKANRTSIAAAYSRHTIDFRIKDAPAVGDVVPRILFSNSHDGSSRASATAGVFRLVCSNGLLAGSVYARENVRHVGDTARELVERMKALAKNTAPLFAQIDEWRTKELTASAQRDFATFAAMMRWKDPLKFTPEDILGVRRPEDVVDDLWHVFNRVQENTVKGGLHGVTMSGRAALARPLNEAGANMKFNLDLWRLAEEFNTF